jgi:hypothetical protein
MEERQFFNQALKWTFKCAVKSERKKLRHWWDIRPNYWNVVLLEKLTIVQLVKKSHSLRWPWSLIFLLASSRFYLISRNGRIQSKLSYPPLCSFTGYKNSRSHFSTILVIQRSVLRITLTDINFLGVCGKRRASKLSITLNWMCMTCYP